MGNVNMLKLPLVDTTCSCLRYKTLSRHPWEEYLHLENMKINQKSFTFIDLFSGCGGLSNGLEMAGHTCLLGVDANKEAMATFAANHKHAETFLGDIKKLDEKKKICSNQK